MQLFSLCLLFEHTYVQESFNHNMSLGLHTAGTQSKYIHLSSVNRDHELYEDPSFCRLELGDELKQVSEIELIHFEIANPRNTIENGINHEFVYSEYDADNDRYNTYLCKLPDGTYPLSTLLNVLQGAMNCPTRISHLHNPYNTYNCQADGVGGRIRIESFTTLPENTQRQFQLHFGTGRYLNIENVDIANDQVIFQAGETPYEEWRPGHMLTFAPRRSKQLEVQVYSWIDSRTLQLRVGDLSVPLAGKTFAEIQPVTIESKYHTSPALTRLLGFEEVDLQGGSTVQVLAMSNPTAYQRDGSDREVTLVIETRYDIGPVQNKKYRISGSGTFLDSIDTLTVHHTQNSANFIAFIVDLLELWKDGLTASDGTASEDAISIVYDGTDANGIMTLKLTFNPGHSLDVGTNSLFLTGFVGYTGAPIEAAVAAWVGDEVSLYVAFPFTPTLATTQIQHINSLGTPIQYVSPKNFDLTASRRICLVALTAGDISVGHIHAAASKEKYFARIQLDSGPLQVQFAAGKNILGYYLEPNPIQSVTRITLRFVTEDGHPFPFIGVDWSLCLRMKCEKL